MSNSEMRAIAIDWSGRVDGEQEFIWLAEAVDGQIVRLENGWTRGQVIAWLNEMATKNPDVVVGIDFAFSMPKWFVQNSDAETASEFWEVVTRNGEIWLATCSEPFFGKKGTKRLSPEL